MSKMEKRNRYADTPIPIAGVPAAEKTEATSVKDLYNKLGDATYYDEERLNSIVLYEQVYGTLAVMFFCEINILKYRLRVGRKAEQPIEQELLKAGWYERAAKFYYDKIRAGHAHGGIDNLVSPDLVKRHGLPWNISKESDGNQVVGK